MPFSEEVYKTIASTEAITTLYLGTLDSQGLNLNLQSAK